MLMGYVKATGFLLGVNEKHSKGSVKKDRDYAKKEFRGISIWTLRSCTNIIRTFREVNDIVTFRIKKPLHILKNKYNYNLNIFLQSDDQIIPAQVSKEHLKDVLPEDNVRMVPGGHNDIFFQQWQRPAFLDFLKEIRARMLS
jgi:putative intracellular protease/amidase